ncbi:MAG TPA: hypothetical protein VEC09_00065 [Actinomycetota bacterium]|nr:hypothetical protein [Actinomycetota bacterium]
MRSAVVPILAGTLLSVVACSDDPRIPAGSDDAANEALVDPIVAEEGLTSCAFEFSVEALRDRGFAFDGEVTGIEAPEAMDAPYVVTFEVGRWYTGGDSPTIALKTYDISGTSLAGDLGLEIGDRVLAAGDDGFLWGCGFSAHYDDDGAARFERAFDR